MDNDDLKNETEATLTRSTPEAPPSNVRPMTPEEQNDIVTGPMKFDIHPAPAPRVQTPEAPKPISMEVMQLERQLTPEEQRVLNTEDLRALQEDLIPKMHGETWPVFEEERIELSLPIIRDVASKIEAYARSKETRLMGGGGWETLGPEVRKMVIDLYLQNQGGH